MSWLWSRGNEQNNNNDDDNHNATGEDFISNAKKFTSNQNSANLFAEEADVNMETLKHIPVDDEDDDELGTSMTLEQKQASVTETLRLRLKKDGTSEVMGIPLDRNMTETYMKREHTLAEQRKTLAQTFEIAGSKMMSEEHSLFQKEDRFDRETGTFATPDDKSWMQTVRSRLMRSVDRDKWLWMIRALDAKLDGSTKPFREVDPKVRGLFEQSEGTRELKTPRDLDDCVFCALDTASDKQVESLAIDDPFRIVSIPRGDGRDLCFDVLTLWDYIGTFVRKNPKAELIPLPVGPLIYKGRSRFFTVEERKHITQWYLGYVKLSRDMDSRGLTREQRNQLVMLGQHMYEQDMVTVEEPTAANVSSPSRLGEIVKAVLELVPESIRAGVYTGVTSLKDNTLKLVRYVASNPHWIRICMIIADVLRMVVCTFITLYFVQDYALAFAPMAMIVGEYFMTKLLWLAEGWFGGLGKKLKEIKIFGSLLRIFHAVADFLESSNLPMLSTALRNMIHFLEDLHKAWMDRGMNTTVVMSVVAAGILSITCPGAMLPLVVARLKWRFLQVLADACGLMIERWTQDVSQTYELGKFRGAEGGGGEVAGGDWSRGAHQFRIFLWIMTKLCPLAGGGRKICEAGMRLVSRFTDSFFFLTSIGTAILDIMLYAQAVRSGDVAAIQAHAQSCAVSVLSYQFSAKGCLCWDSKQSLVSYDKK